MKLPLFTLFFCVVFNLFAGNELPVKNTNAITFKENKGQVSDQNYKPRPDVLFSGSANGMVYHLKNDGISYQLYRVDSWKEKEESPAEKLMNKIKEPQKIPDKTTVYRLDVNWLNTNKNVIVEKGKPIDGYDNYYLEVCPNGVTNVRSYEDITYKNIYNGIDLHYYSKDGNLKYDYIVKPGADYKKIQLQIQGAKKISVNPKGELVIKTPLSEIIEGTPVVFQEGKKLDAKWVVKENLINFEIGDFNPSMLMIIDPPVRIWGTYYGGTVTDQLWNASIDKSGNMHLAGVSDSPVGIATSGSHQQTLNGNYDAFLAKFDTNGNLVWGTYYGSGTTDYGMACCSDLSRNVYLTGYTVSSLASIFATSSSHQQVYGGGVCDAFLVKFDSNGVRIWATYYGGSANDEGRSCVTDMNKNVYLAGLTLSPSSTLIATGGAHQTSFGGNNDAFLVKFDSLGVRQWGTYYGGSNYEMGLSLATDQSGNVYFAGRTDSNSGIATGSGHQPSFGGGYDAFLTKFNSNGIRQWGTYYGGIGIEEGLGCSIDNAGSIYLCGYSTSTVANTAIATIGSHQQLSNGGGSDGFLVKFNLSGVRQWGTFYGGTGGSDNGSSCFADNLGNVYLAGRTDSNPGTGIETPGCFQAVYSGGSTDAFLIKFKSNGVRSWGTYYGGTGKEEFVRCHADNNGNIFLAGFTSSTNSMVTTGCYQPVFGGGSYDNFLVKFFDCPSVSINTTSNNVCAGSTLSISAIGANSYTWNTSAIGSSIVVTPSVSTNYSVTGTTGTCVSTNTIAINVNPLPSITASTSSVAVCSGRTSCLFSSGATTYTWVGPCAFISTQQNPCFTFMSSCSCGYTVTGTDTNGCTNTATVCLNVNPNPTVTAVTSGSIICTGQTATLTSNGANTYTWSTSATGSTTAVSPTVNTNYTVTGTDANGCINSASITQSVSACAGINELTGNAEIQIYPNPGTGLCVVSVGNLKQNTNITVFNTLGELILSKEIRSLQTEINLSSFANGLYIVKISGGNSESYSVKIIKH
jgi:hypothetical protein